MYDAMALREMNPHTAAQIATDFINDHREEDEPRAHLVEVAMTIEELRGVH